MKSFILVKNTQNQSALGLSDRKPQGNPGICKDSTHYAILEVTYGFPKHKPPPTPSVDD